MELAKQMDVAPPHFLTTATRAFCQIGFLINTRAKAQGFCICTMLARVLVDKDGAHEGAADAQNRAGKPH